jgi:hypothetical protein
VLQAKLFGLQSRLFIMQAIFTFLAFMPNALLVLPKQQ